MMVPRSRVEIDDGVLKIRVKDVHDRIEKALYPKRDNIPPLQTVPVKIVTSTEPTVPSRFTDVFMGY